MHPPSLLKLPQRGVVGGFPLGVVGGHPLKGVSPYEWYA
jgi:hypothetical protein